MQQKLIEIKYINLYKFYSKIQKDKINGADNNKTFIKWKLKQESKVKILYQEFQITFKIKLLPLKNI